MIHNCPARNHCPWCGRWKRCGASHLRARHRHIACCYRCALAREAKQRAAIAKGTGQEEVGVL